MADPPPPIWNVTWPCSSATIELNVQLNDCAAVPSVTCRASAAVNGSVPCWTVTVMVAGTSLEALKEKV